MTFSRREAAVSNLRFEDVEVGDELRPLDKGRITRLHLMRWSAATENWHRIHYDERFTIEHDKLPGLLINGSLKQNFILQLLKDWAGEGGWVWKVSFQFRAMDVVDSSLFVWARVTGAQRRADFGLIELELGIKNSEGRESTPGKATVALPYRDGAPLPYPFFVKQS
jgi:acyl dehydratase